MSNALTVIAYKKSPHESRRKIRTGSSGLAHIDHIITPLIRDNGQSVAHVFHSNSESLGISRSTLYQYINDWYYVKKNNCMDAIKDTGSRRSVEMYRNG